MWWSTGSGKIELKITKAQARAGSHQGRCDDDIAWLLKDKTIAQQMRKLDPETVKAELREYGAWDDDELGDHDQNLARLLWIACGDIAEGK